MGRPRKPSAIKALEGNRSRREIPEEIPLHGTPDVSSIPNPPDANAIEHFTFLAAEFGGAGVLKRADGPSLAMLADLWSKYWEASAAKDIDAMCKLKQRWDSAASKLGLSPIDRSRLLIAKPEQHDPLEERFFKVTG